MKMDGVPRDFVRGAVASGLLAAAGRERGDLPHAALLGGLALTAGGAAERLLFDRKEIKMSKKKRNKRSKRRSDAAGSMANGNARGGLAALFGDKPNQQFLAGALIGAAAAYVLGDEQLRGKLMRAGLRLYANLTANIEEMKEQMGDVRAELEAEQRGAV